MSRTIARVAVVGAGTMGHGIAQVAAAAGCTVSLIDTTEDLVKSGVARIRENLDGAITRGKATAADRDSILARIATSVDVNAAVRDADLIVEAVPERMDLKIALLQALDPIVPDDVILATNTSSLSITALQQATTQPSRVIGLHFFNPVHINKLIEVVRGRETAQVVVDAGLAFARRIGKEPVLVNDAPGFATSRLGVLLGLEAIRMVEQGVATAADIDRAMELGYRHPMGPLRLTDLVGLDIRLDIARYLHQALDSEAFRPPALLEQMVAAGRLGRKSGQGFYEWTEVPAA
ncbi:MAG: 3-hydroxyacyl-CoA dehydrogenase family protein [Longimicrobiales bacterium]